MATRREFEAAVGTLQRTAFNRGQVDESIVHGHLDRDHYEGAIADARRRLFALWDARGSCDGCRRKPAKDGGDYPLECLSCARWYRDYYDRGGEDASSRASDGGDDHRCGPAVDSQRCGACGGTGWVPDVETLDRPGAARSVRCPRCNALGGDDG